MTMNRLLNFSSDSSVMGDVLEMVDTQGYTPEEAIPGLVLAILMLAEMTGYKDQALDEAINILADGPQEDEVV